MIYLKNSFYSLDSPNKRISSRRRAGEKRRDQEVRIPTNESKPRDHISYLI